MSVDKALFAPIKSRRAFEEISANIKSLIFKGVLKPGDRLPSEVELAKQYQVGRQTIREAFRILELSGLLTVQKGYGGGPMITDNILDRITTLFLDAMQWEKFSLDEFTSARITIEKAILNEAIDKVDEQDILKLQENVDKAKALVKKNKPATIENFEFHTLLAKASKNNLYIIMEGAINAIHSILRRRYTLPYDKTKAGAFAHEKILGAIIKRDREKALSLLERDIITVSKSMVPISNNIVTSGSGMGMPRSW